MPRWCRFCSRCLRRCSTAWRRSCSGWPPRPPLPPRPCTCPCSPTCSSTRCGWLASAWSRRPRCARPSRWPPVRSPVQPTNDLAGTTRPCAGAVGPLPGPQGTGCSECEVVTFMARVNGPVPLSRADEPPANPRTMFDEFDGIPGSSPLRLLAGDATKSEADEELDGGGVADLLVTDPPYGVDDEVRQRPNSPLPTMTSRVWPKRQAQGPDAAPESTPCCRCGLRLRSRLGRARLPPGVRRRGFRGPARSICTSNASSVPDRPALQLGNTSRSWARGKRQGYDWYGGQAATTVIDDDVKLCGSPSKVSSACALRAFREYQARQFTTV